MQPHRAGCWGFRFTPSCSQNSLSFSLRHLPDPFGEFSIDFPVIFFQGPASCVYNTWKNYIFRESHWGVIIGEAGVQLPSCLAIYLRKGVPLQEPNTGNLGSANLA